MQLIDGLIQTNLQTSFLHVRALTKYIFKNNDAVKTSIVTALRLCNLQARKTYFDTQTEDLLAQHEKRFRM